MNAYTSIANIRAIDATLINVNDDVLLNTAVSASRLVDHLARREFYVHYATKQYTIASYAVDIDDLLVVDSVKVINGDIETTLTSDDYELRTLNSRPPYTWIALKAKYSGTIEITGWFGAGNLELQSPFVSLGVTCTCDASATELNFTSVSLARGDMIRIDDEIMRVDAVGSTSITVRRAQNGTTAAAHTNSVVLVPIYPDIVRSCTNYIAIALLRKIQSAGLSTERLGDYSYSSDADTLSFAEHALYSVRRMR